MRVAKAAGYVRDGASMCRTLLEIEDDTVITKAAQEAKPDTKAQGASEGAQEESPQYVDNPQRYTESYAGVHQMQHTPSGLLDAHRTGAKGRRAWMHRQRHRSRKQRH